MVTSKSFDINKSISGVHNRLKKINCGELFCYLKYSTFQTYDSGVKLQMKKIDNFLATTIVHLITSIITIPIYLHQDYNYNQYGKCLIFFK